MAIAQAALREPEKYVRISPAGDRMQDIGSQSIVPLLALEAGQSFLDLCAAPGNKTAQALEAGVRAVACDLHFHRLHQLKPLTADLVVLDGTRPLPFARRFDRILVDAPCSGTGTLGRNPEIKWRLTPGDLDDLRGRQSALLANALRGARSRRSAGVFDLFAGARGERRRHGGGSRGPDCRANAQVTGPRRRGRFLRLCDKISVARK